MTVVVSDNGSGKLVAVVDDGHYATPEFSNSYDTEDTSVTLDAKKVGSNLGDRTFEFELLDASEKRIERIECKGGDPVG